MAQLMSLPLTISYSSKSRLVLTFLVLHFWYLLTRVVLDKFQKSSKTVVCVCCKLCDFTQANKDVLFCSASAGFTQLGSAANPSRPTVLLKSYFWIGKDQFT